VASGSAETQRSWPIREHGVRIGKADVIEEVMEG
jgi:hypothetical protein